MYCKKYGFRNGKIVYQMAISKFCNSKTSIKRNIKILVPREPFVKKIDQSNMPEPPELTQDLVDHLERLSLVRFSNEEAVRHLEKAIRYADELRTIDTTGVEPMDSVLENETLRLRDDRVTEGNCKAEILANAAKTAEHYFVTPPGNVPLEERVDKLGVLKSMKKKR